MKIAYFISLHHKSYQFEWLWRAIYNPDDIFLIHVDLKSRAGVRKERTGVHAAARRLTRACPNVRWLRSRPTNWGGWSLSKLMLDAVDHLLMADSDWSRFVNLSGQCYPIKPMAQIRRSLEQAGDLEFVELRPFSTLPPDDWHLRRQAVLETPIRAFALPGVRRPPSGFAMDNKGSQWCILSRAFCEWRREAPVSRHVRRYLRNSLLSDELIFQTLLVNGPYRDRAAAHYGREIRWPGPRVLTLADFGALQTSEGLFARKFDARADVAILNALADSGGYVRGPQPPLREASTSPSQALASWARGTAAGVTSPRRHAP